MDSALTREVLEALLMRKGSELSFGGGPAPAAAAGGGGGGGGGGSAPDAPGGGGGGAAESSRRSRSRGADADARLRSQSRGRSAVAGSSAALASTSAAQRSRSLRGVSIERRRRFEPHDSTSSSSSSDEEGGRGRGRRLNRAAAAASVSGASRKMLQSLDLCNCTSARFVEALTSFVDAHLRQRVTHTLDEEDSDARGDDDDGEMAEHEERRGRARVSAYAQRQQSAGGSTLLGRADSRSRSASHQRAVSRFAARRNQQPVQFPSMLRLGLSGLTVPPEVLNPFVLAFPRLTHLDLSRTKADDALLLAIARQGAGRMSLQALSLAHCRSLGSAAMYELLVESPVTRSLTQLCLEFSLMFPSPFSRDEFARLLENAPCLRSGAMRYLDLGACPLTDESLATSLAPQPALIDLGLASAPLLSLQAIGTFLKDKAPNVQVLDIEDSCQLRNGSQLSTGQGGIAISAFDLNQHILAPCTDTPPVPLSVQLALMGFTQSAGGLTREEALKHHVPRPATNLRVVGVSRATLSSVADGIGGWRVIMGAGRRGWVVDTRAATRADAKDPPLFEARPGPGEPLDAHAGAHGRGRVTSTLRNPATHRASSVGGPHNASPGPSPLRLSSAAVVRSPSHGRAQEMHAASSGAAGDDSESTGPLTPRDEVVRGLPEDHPRVKALRALAAANGHVSGDTGWHPKKMEVLLGYGMLGREQGSYAHVAYQR